MKKVVSDEEGHGDGLPEASYSEWHGHGWHQSPAQTKMVKGGSITCIEWRGRGRPAVAAGSAGLIGGH